MNPPSDSILTLKNQHRPEHDPVLQSDMTHDIAPTTPAFTDMSHYMDQFPVEGTNNEEWANLSIDMEWLSCLPFDFNFDETLNVV